MRIYDVHYPPPFCSRAARHSRGAKTIPWGEDERVDLAEFKDLGEIGKIAAAVLRNKHHVFDTNGA